jgi:hypothetical protein
MQKVTVTQTKPDGNSIDYEFGGIISYTTGMTNPSNGTSNSASNGALNGASNGGKHNRRAHTRKQKCTLRKTAKK